ncbi:hypothetical protein vBVpaMR16F_195 [Vibrio phage vB_VpaM_R16F]|nr:hypothetical protein vBVpaMR16F_195 [Vibrio phage vB_VpaM_R16F]
MEVQKQKQLDYLLGKLQEEAGEIVVEVSKAKCFGLYEKYSPEHPTNLQRFVNEVKDLVSIASIIGDLYDIDFGVKITEEEYFNYKKEKLMFYSDLSEHLGLLEDDNGSKDS